MNFDTKPRPACSEVFKSCNCTIDDNGNGRRQLFCQTPYSSSAVNQVPAESSCHGENPRTKVKIIPVKGGSTRDEKTGNTNTSSHNEQGPGVSDSVVEKIIKTECLVTAAGGVVGTFKPPFLIVFDMRLNGQGYDTHKKLYLLPAVGGTGAGINGSVLEIDNNNNTKTKTVGKNMDLVYPSNVKVSELMGISIQFPKFDEDFDLAYEYLADDLIRMSRDMDLN